MKKTCRHSMHACLLMVLAVGHRVINRVEARRTKAAVDDTSNAHINLAVGILSAPAHFAARVAIRQSWGTDKHLRHVRFFIGDPNDDYIKRRVALEQADHGDVHMSPWYTDSNSNDTLKVYDMLEWAINLPNITHLIKVDDTSYLRASMFAKVLASTAHEYVYVGNMYNNTRPDRDWTSHWFVSEQAWQRDGYPMYAHRAGYAISTDIVRELLKQGDAPTVILPNVEDACMGIWIEHVAKGLPVKYVDVPAISPWRCKDSDIISHYIPPHAMLCMQQQRGKCCDDYAPVE